MKQSLCILFLFSLALPAQTLRHISIVITDSSATEFKPSKKIYDDNKEYLDTIQLQKKTDGILSAMREDGFLAASIDSISRDTSGATVYVFAGDRYTWASIGKGNVPEEFLDGTGFRKKLYSGKPFRYDQVVTLTSKILRNCENKGYPFATVTLDSVSIVERKFSAVLAIEKNRFIRIDSVIIRGTASVAPVYIYNYIGITPGDVYRESQVKKLSSRFKELPFVKEIKPSQVLFTEKDVKLYLYLENKKASQFDGVIGFLPDESNPGKLNLTGEVHLKLQNSLKRGEVIELDWHAFPGKTQDLRVHGLYPFLFNTPFGLDGALAIYKKDSTYIDVTKNLGVQYSLTGNNFLKAFVNDKQSDLQSTEGLENITVLPPYADITTTSYGLAVHYEILDYRLNPRKGFMVETNGSTGNRIIRKNSDINPAAYDSISLRSVTYQGVLRFEYYFSLGGRHVINVGDQTGYIFNENLFTNELYRIGGLKSLRGFDEESIYASSYTIGKLEYRYLLEQNSFLFTFVNMAWYENRSGTQFLTDTPVGFGAGINFETRIGIMSVSYALGKQFDNPVLFRNGKVHFGIVNYF